MAASWTAVAFALHARVPVRRPSIEDGQDDGESGQVGVGCAQRVLGESGEVGAVADGEATGVVLLAGGESRVAGHALQGLPGGQGLVRVVRGTRQIAARVRETVDCIRRGLPECPSMPHRETVHMMEQMDHLRAQMGIRYPCEETDDPA